MNVLAYLRSVGAKLFRRNAVADEMEEELRSHIELVPPTWNARG